MLLNFEKVAAENVIIYLTRQQSVTKLRQQIKDGRIRLKERKKNKVLVKFLNDNIRFIVKRIFCIAKCILKYNLHVFVIWLMIPSFSVVIKLISCFLLIENVSIDLDTFISRLRLFMLLSEMYWHFSNLSPFLLNDSKSTHVVIIWSGRRAYSFMSIFKSCPSCNRILPGYYSTRMLFRNCFWLFQRIIIDKFNKSVTHCVYGRLKHEGSSMQFSIKWFGRCHKTLYRFSQCLEK